MINKFEEGFVSSFQYNPPEDPEKLLYDFYFFVGYVNPSDFPHDEDQYALAEAVNDCTLYLRKHMIQALKFSMSAEVRHAKDQTEEFEDKADLKKAMGTFPDSIKKFLFAYVKEISFRRFGSSLATLDPRAQRIQTKFKKDPMLNKEFDAKRRDWGRSEEYGDAYESLLATQKKLDISEIELADILIFLFDKLTWDEGFGGEAWGNIAKAYRNLLLANTLQDRVVWIDHAYDLQHNTDTVFNKLKLYYKWGYSWIQRALNWKRDETDLRAFYFKVSPGVKPLVGFVARTKGVYIEDIIPTPAKPGAKAKPKAKPAKENY